MKKLFLLAGLAASLTGCNTKTDSVVKAAADTLTYAYKATYSSDITVPGNPVNAQKVLQIWKMFETVNIQAMKPYFADSVKYNAADGCLLYTSDAADDLLCVDLGGR